MFPDMIKIDMIMHRQITKEDKCSQQGLADYISARDECKDGEGRSIVMIDKPRSLL